MNITLVHIHRSPAENRYVWTPFALNDEFNVDWWDSPPYLVDNPHYVRADLDGIEVARIELARIELDHDFGGCLHLGAPELGTIALEIQSR